MCVCGAKTKNWTTVFMMGGGACVCVCRCLLRVFVFVTRAYGGGALVGLLLLEHSEERFVGHDSFEERRGEGRESVFSLLMRCDSF